MRDTGTTVDGKHRAREKTQLESCVDKGEGLGQLVGLLRLSVIGRKKCVNFAAQLNSGKCRSFVDYAGRRTAQMDFVKTHPMKWSTCHEVPFQGVTDYRDKVCEFVDPGV
jgi:hypothetical protein